jgi:hypothetical protein
VADVSWAPYDDTTYGVPACAPDAELVAAGADPDTRMVLDGAQWVPYYQGGPVYRPYAAGYFGSLDV